MVVVVLMAVVVVMLAVALAAEGRQRVGLGVRVVTWEEFARTHQLDPDERRR